MTKVWWLWAVGVGSTVTSCGTGGCFIKNLRKIGRILWNIVRWAEPVRGYPDKAIEILWNKFGRPAQLRRTVQAIGKVVHHRACRIQKRDPLCNYTRFFRNFPQLQVLRNLVLDMDHYAGLKLAVLGCSTGGEVYSALWMIRTARPDLKVSGIGIDISETNIQQAILGIYPLGSREVEGITEITYPGLFTRQGDTLRVEDWLRGGVIWQVCDVCSRNLRDGLGLQDFVLANNLLCHMSDPRAEDCLRNIAKLLALNGYLFVWGIDLNVRTRIIRGLGFTPVAAKLEEIYAADQRATEVWPLKYWGIEPMDKGRSDWKMRYATIFKAPGDVKLDGMNKSEQGSA
jgi:hypothetical protein